MENKDMNVALVTYTAGAELVCEAAAAMCVGEEMVLSLKHLKAALNAGHASVLEHAGFTFRITGISRVTLAQLTRHRMASYSVLSQRYCAVKQGAFVSPGDGYGGFAKDAVQNYCFLMDFGKESRENARYILPEGTQTSLILTMNARELRHFFALRCCSRAQWEIRQLANSMLGLCWNVAPVLFENAGPSCVQRGYCPEARSCGKAPKLAQLRAAYDAQGGKSLGNE